MLTKNAYTIIFGILNKASSIPVKQMSGDSFSFNIGNYSLNSGVKAFDQFGFNLSSGRPYITGVYFGDGNVAPSVDDYKLSGDFITDLSYFSINVSMDFGDGYIGLQATLVVKNSADTPKTLTEAGLFCVSNDTDHAVLVDRIVLATPITIPAGGTKSITYNLRHTY